MELIVFNFIMHILSLLMTIGFSVYVYYYASMRYLHEFLGYLFLTCSLINIINLLPLLIKDVIWLKYKIAKGIELRNKRIAEEFLQKLQTKNAEKHDNTLFTDIISGKQNKNSKEEPAELEEISDDEYIKLKALKNI